MSTVTDLFCGAGGSSLGASLVPGVEIKMAMNHWQLAIETHNTNFPNTDHHCADVSQMNPRYYPKTDILIGSPECTNHSLAKGAKRKRFEGGMLFPEFGPEPEASVERSRATMWDMLRFAEAHHYDVVFVENVPDVTKWIMYEAWKMAWRSLGYELHEVSFNSMFAGVPQSRDRFYAVATKKGIPKIDLDICPPAWCWDCEKQVLGVQTWKKPGTTAGKYKQQYVYTCPDCKAIVSPYAEAAWTAIDWTIKGQRIGDRDKPLAEATMERIRAGIEKYWRQPGIVDVSRGAEKMRPVDDPLFTQTARNVLALYTPYIMESHGTSTARSVDSPLMGITAGGNHHWLVEPFYTKGYTSKVGGSDMVGRASDPLGSITTQDHHGVVMPPFLASYYSREDASRLVNEAMGTLTSEPRHGLVTPPMMVKVGAGTYERPGSGYARVREVTEPMTTLTGTLGDALFSPMLVDLAMNYQRHSSDRTKPVTLPFNTVTTAYTLGMLTPAGGTWNDEAKSVDQPMSSLTTREALGLAMMDRQAFIQAYYGGSNVLTDKDQPMSTVTGVARHGLVEMDQVPAIEDCSFRMLEPHEIGRGMAFTPTYVVKGNKRDQVRQYGNAVTPPVMTMLVGRAQAAMAREGKHANKKEAA